MIHMNIDGRLGNQFFQLWVGCWLAEQLDRKLTVYFRFGLLIPFHAMKNMPHFEVVQYIDFKKHDPNNGYYVGATTSIYDIVNQQKNNTNPIYISMYFEDFSNIKNNINYIKNIYDFEHSHPKTDYIAIHFRLGDLAKAYEPIYSTFIQTCVDIIKTSYSTYPVYIITEDPNHKCVNDMFSLLDNVAIVSSDYLSDFTLVSSAKVIFCTDSTFTWWASFLNKQDPMIYFLISKSLSPYKCRLNLFAHDYFPNWNCIDLDQYMIKRKYIL